MSNIYIFPVIIFFTTILFGLGIMLLLNRYVYPYPDLPGVTSYNNVLFGDGVVFPLYNGYITYLFMSRKIIFTENILLFSIIISLLTTSLYAFWRIKINSVNDWSRPLQGVVNWGGRFHILYFFCQLSVIIYSFYEIIVSGRLFCIIISSVLLFIYLLLAIFPEVQLRKNR